MLHLSINCWGWRDLQRHFQNLPPNAFKQLLPLLFRISLIQSPGQSYSEEQPWTASHPVCLQSIFMWHNPVFNLSQWEDDISNSQPHCPDEECSVGWVYSTPSNVDQIQHTERFSFSPTEQWSSYFALHLVICVSQLVFCQQCNLTRSDDCYQWSSGESNDNQTSDFLCSHWLLLGLTGRKKGIKNDTLCSKHTGGLKRLFNLERKTGCTMKQLQLQIPSLNSLSYSNHPPHL